MALNSFDDFHRSMLEQDPQMAYMGQLAGTQFGGTQPMQQRAQDYFTNQYSNVYNQYLGRRGQELAQKKDPSEWTSFTDYLQEVPFTQRYTNLTPLQRGVSNRKFSPSTRFLFF
tara:strand:+ start:268 stop:609 length:342 start_codon:yes stop_codon:yes gene_type:complete